MLTAESFAGVREAITITPSGRSVFGGASVTGPPHTVGHTRQAFLPDIDLHIITILLPMRLPGHFYFGAKARDHADVRWGARVGGIAQSTAGGLSVTSALFVQHAGWHWHCSRHNTGERGQPQTKIASGRESGSLKRRRPPRRWHAAALHACA